MSEKQLKSISAPEISQDGKAIRVVFLDSDDKLLPPLLVSTYGMAQIIDRLSKAVDAAVITQALSEPEGTEEFKPTPQMYQAKDLRIVYNAQIRAAALVLKTFESVELHLVFRPTLFRQLIELAQQVEGVQMADSDSVN
jgi:hypothetical protein